MEFNLEDDEASFLYGDIIVLTKQVHSVKKELKKVEQSGDNTFMNILYQSIEAIKNLKESDEEGYVDQVVELVQQHDAVEQILTPPGKRIKDIVEQSEFTDLDVAITVTKKMVEDQIKQYQNLEQLW